MKGDRKQKYFKDLILLAAVTSQGLKQHWNKWKCVLFTGLKNNIIKGHFLQN